MGWDDVAMHMGIIATNGGGIGVVINYLSF
jgi:hypothetical protein